jgi:hypothetical protein
MTAFDQKFIENPAYLKWVWNVGFLLLSGFSTRRVKMYRRDIILVVNHLNTLNG